MGLDKEAGVPPATTSEDVSSIPLTMPSVHERVITLLKDERRGSLLDAGAGRGALSQKLAELGFKVLASDLEAADFKVTGIDFREANLNEPLPYPDGSFDYITCVEVIEHLENPHHLVREFARLLKPGGKLIITTPNILDVVSRIRYLLYGSTPFEVGLEPQYAKGHINLIGLPELFYILIQNKMIITEIVTNRLKQKAYLVWPLVWILRILLAIRDRSRNVDKELITYLASRELIAGEIVIVKAVKGG